MKTPGQKAIDWIEQFCLVPFGFDKGQYVRLTTEQKEILHRVFDAEKFPRRCPLIWRCFILPGRVIWRRMFPHCRSGPTASQLGTRSAPLYVPW
jgi:hypothetical protein